MTQPVLDALDPHEVAVMKAQLSRVSDVAFAESLADCIMDPDAIEQAAFRSAELVERSRIAAKFLIDTTNSRIRSNAPDASKKEWEQRASYFRDRVGMERRLLDRVALGLRAQLGELPTPPNPRAQAYRELARRYPVEYLAILREIDERAKAERKAKKKQRRSS